MNAHVYTVEVVSPQFPCGAAWLANALLELDVPLPHLWGFDTATEWQVLADGRWRYTAAHLPWKQALASLRLGRIFQFQSGVRPRFSHGFPWQLDADRKVLLITRDPRDALYSEWQRHRRNEGLALDTSFLDFLRQPFYGWPIAVADLLWLHLSSWKTWAKARPQQFHVLRFEDFKRDPVAALTVASEWMGVASTPAARECAAQASDVCHLQAIECVLTEQHPQTRQLNRLGRSGEWRETWTADGNRAFGAHWRSVFSALGYPEPADYAGPPEHVDLAALLRWQGIGDSQNASMLETRANAAVVL